MQTPDSIPEQETNLRSQIKASCLRLLARREHSQKELLQKLQAKGYKKADVLAVLTHLSEQHWQDDQRFTEQYVRDCLQRGYGPVYITYQLQQRGIHQVDFDSLLTEKEDWQQLIKSVYNRKYGQNPVTTQQEWAKRSRFLQQRGFTYGMINTLWNDLKITT